MGLDQFFFKRKRDAQNEEPEEVAYFRKHSDLHGYMQELYEARGGEGTFNCVQLHLDKDDVKKLETLVKLELTHGKSVFNEARGFFWGESDVEDWKETIEFLKSIADFDYERYELFYDSWW